MAHLGQRSGTQLQGVTIIIILLLVANRKELLFINSPVTGEVENEGVIRLDLTRQYTWLADDIRVCGFHLPVIRPVIGKISSALNPATLTRAAREASTSATQADRKTKKPITNMSFRSPVRLGLNLSQAVTEIKNFYCPVFSEQWPVASEQARMRFNVGLSAQPKLWPCRLLTILPDTLVRICFLSYLAIYLLGTIEKQLKFISECNCFNLFST